MATATPHSRSAFDVPRWLDTLGGLVDRHPQWWIGLGRLEDRLLADEVAEIDIDRPIYISGLARSGSTILLELLSSTDDTVSHAYKDFPPVFAPWMWNRFLEHSQRTPAKAVERAHGDGIEVTADSPEALEEVLWMAFFPDLHDPTTSDVLDGDTRSPEFEAFYRAHLRKLIWLRGGRRYLAKANYNITRLAYLHRLFPDARFVIPIREPLWHIASLQRQHQRFTAHHQDDPRALRYMQRVGHFEFGLDRRPINVNDPETTRRIVDAWAQGEEIEGWARLWSAVYAHVARTLASSPSLREATLVVRYEDLCRSPRTVLDSVFEHCDLRVDEALIEQAAQRLRFPDYYEPGFSPSERQTIAHCTRTVAAHFGYQVPAPDAMATEGSAAR